MENEVRRFTVVIRGTAKSGTKRSIVREIKESIILDDSVVRFEEPEIIVRRAEAPWTKP